MSATIQDPRPLHELAPGLALARGGPGRTLNIYLLGTVVVDSGVRWSRRRLARQLAGRQVTAARLAGLRPRLACFGHGLRSPIQAGSPPPWTSWARRPRSVPAASRPPPTPSRRSSTSRRMLLS